MERTEVVFHPNMSTERLESLLKSSDARGAVTWSSKKDANPSQLYLFYWGQPHARIVAVARPTGEVERSEGKVDWTSARVQYYADFEPLIALDSPVSADEIKGDRILSRWWAKKPYQGYPKVVEPPYADRLLGIIVRKNENVRHLVAQTIARLPPPRKELDRELRDLPDSERKRVLREMALLLRDARLRPRVLRVWGAACAVCGVSIEKGAEAECEVAHIEPVASGGADKIGNALPLCRTHHWAFDRFLWAIEPNTFKVRVAPEARNTVLAQFDGRRLRAPSGEKRQPLRKAIAASALKKRWAAFCR